MKFYVWIVIKNMWVNLLIFSKKRIYEHIRDFKIKKT